MSYTVKKSTERTLMEVAQFGVQSQNLAPNAVRTTNVADSAITGQKVAEGAIGTLHIQDAAITSAKIGDLSADKIKAGTLKVTDSVGSGVSSIVVESGGYEKVRLDEDGILVNDGNIMVRSESGATVISPQGVNVETTNVPLSQSFNYVRNAFFKALTPNVKTDLDDNGNYAWAWSLQKDGLLEVKYGLTDLTAHEGLLKYGLDIGAWGNSAKYGTVLVSQNVLFSWLNPYRDHCVSVRHHVYVSNPYEPCGSVKLVVELKHNDEVVFSENKPLELYDSSDGNNYNVTSITIPSRNSFPAPRPNNVSVSIFAERNDPGIFKALVSGVVLEQGLRQTDNAYTNINEYISAFDILPGTIQPEHLAPNAGVPPGAVMTFAMQTPPAGWLAADGRYLDNGQYPDLFAAIGYTYGQSGTKFRLPDLRGEFVRGWDDGRGIDDGRQLGSWQDDALQGHWHNIWSGRNDNTQYHAPGSQTGHIGNKFPANYDAGDNYVRDPVTDGINGTPRTTYETRPRNVALLYCIKY